MRCRLAILAICLVGTVSLRAEEPAVASSPTAATAPPITDPVVVAEHYRQMLTRPEFQETVEPDVDARFKEMLSQWFLRLGAKIGEFKYANRIPAFESLLMTLLVGFAMAGLLYIMVRLTRRRIGFDENPADELHGHNPRRPPESFTREIHAAIQNHDWHAAWLIAWRQFLSRLENGRLVEADRTHTNREYLAQLRAQPLPAPALARLTGLVDAYDRFIYGRKSISEPDWIIFHQQLDEAALLLHLDDKSATARAKRDAP